MYAAQRRSAISVSLLIFSRRNFRPARWLSVSFERTFSYSPSAAVTSMPLGLVLAGLLRRRFRAHAGTPLSDSAGIEKTEYPNPRPRSAHVLGPATPSAVRPADCWKRTTAVRVFGSKVGP